MRKKIIYFSGLAFLTAVYAAQPASAPTKESSLTFPTYGFRINPFETPTDSGVLGALVMSYPAMPLSGNRYFPPSVNVMVVPSEKEMGDYVNQERLGMTAKGFSIVKNGDVASDNDWKVEYIAVTQNVAMHWYAHAVWTKGRIYIATGGVPDEMWNQYSDKIKECVNSLQATGTAVIAPMPAISMTSSAAPVPPANSAK